MNAQTETALWFLNTRVKILAPAAAGTDPTSVLKHWAPYGDSPPLHIHETEDEIFYILEGQFRFTLGERTVELRPGQTILAPKGVPHTYCVDSPEGGKWITVTARGDFEALVRAASRPATAPGLPEPHGAPTQDEVESLAALCARHGIRVVGARMQPRAQG